MPSPNRLFGIVLTSLLLFLATANGQATAPTRPASPPLTAEQRQLIDTVNHEPADLAAPKLDLRAEVDGKPNPAFGRIDASFLRQHESFLKRRQKPIGLLFLGDSITAGWDKARSVWVERFQKHNAANFGISGDRTQHVLWRIENGELDGISPKVVVLMIGTNNVRRWSEEQITSGITNIVQAIRTRLPESKILLLGTFPRFDKAEPEGSTIRAKLQRVNRNIAKLDDGKQIRFLEIWNQLLNADGTLSRDVMPDLLHPSEQGYRIWADAMQPLLDEMMR